MECHSAFLPFAGLVDSLHFIDPRIDPLFQLRDAGLRLLGAGQRFFVAFPCIPKFHFELADAAYATVAAPDARKKTRFDEIVGVLRKGTAPDEPHPVRLRFGATAANVLNHPVFDLPGTNISSASTFGRITGTTWGLMPLGSLPQGIVADLFGAPVVAMSTGLIGCLLVVVIAARSPALRRL